jgi:hypothetical protein
VVHSGQRREQVPSAENNDLSVIRGSNGSVGINWHCVTVVAFRQLVWSISIFYPVGQVYWWLPDSVVMRRPSFGQLWLHDISGSRMNADIFRRIRRGISSFPFLTSGRVFRAWTRRSCYWSNALSRRLSVSSWRLHYDTRWLWICLVSIACRSTAREASRKWRHIS